MSEGWKMIPPPREWDKWTSEQRQAFMLAYHRNVVRYKDKKWIVGSQPTQPKVSP